MVNHAMAKRSSHAFRYDSLEECNACHMPKQVLESRGRSICPANTSDLELALEQRRVNPPLHKRQRNLRGCVCRGKKAEPLPLLTQPTARTATLRMLGTAHDGWTTLATPIHHANGCRCQTPNNVPRGPRIMGQYMVVGEHDCVRRNGVDTTLHQ